MKLFILALATTAFAGLANAQNKVVVVPLGSDTYQLSLESVELFSWYGELTQQNVDEVIVEVPANKTLVLTRAILPQVRDNSTRFELLQGTTKKMTLAVADGPNGIGLSNQSLGSGIPFQSGSTVKIRRISSVGNGNFVTLIGHYTSD